MKVKIKKTNRIKSNTRHLIQKPIILIGLIVIVITISILIVLFINNLNKTRMDKIINDVKEEVFNSIPFDISNDITFLEKSTIYENIYFTYESTNKEVITNNGKVAQRLIDIMVQINIMIIIANNETISMQKTVKVLKHANINIMEIIEGEVRKVIKDIIINGEIINNSELPLFIIVDGYKINLGYERYAKTYPTMMDDSNSTDITSIEITTSSDKAIIYISKHGERIRCRIVITINYGGQTKPISFSVYTLE